MSDETRFRLNSFSTASADVQREKLQSLIADVRGPLRAYWKNKGQHRVFYLGVRTWPQYLKEFFFMHIVCMPEKILEIQSETRSAIAEKIEPYLGVDPNGKIASHHKRHAIELMDKLYLRIHDDHVCDDYLQRKQGCEIGPFKIDQEEFIGSKSIRPEGCINVPKGVSIARIAPAKVNADVHILARSDGGPRAQTSESNDDPVENNMPRGIEVIPHEQSDSKLNPLNYYDTLLKKSATDKKTVVLQLLSNEPSHWSVAYTAATKFIKSARTNKPSIMLVPPDSEWESSNQVLPRVSDAQWLAKRIKNVKNAEAFPPPRSSHHDSKREVETDTPETSARSNVNEQHHSRQDSSELLLESSDDEY